MFSVSAASLLVRVTPEPPARPGAGRLGGVVPDRLDRRACRRHRRRLLAAGAVLPLRRHPRRSPASSGSRPLRHSELAARQIGARRAARRCAAALRNRAYLAALAASFRRRLRPGRCAVGDRAAVRAATTCTCPRAGPTRRSWSSASSAACCCCRRAGSPTPVGRRPVIVGRAARRRGRVRCCCRRCPPTAGLLAGSVLLGVAGAADSVAPGRGHGRRRRRPRRHRGRGVPDGRRPRRGARPGRRRLDRRRRRLRRDLRRERRGVRCCRSLAVLAAPETLVGLGAAVHAARSDAAVRRPNARVPPGCGSVAGRRSVHRLADGDVAADRG